MRVLMQNRSNAFTQRGGDTIVMERLTEGLRARGIEVEFELLGQADVRGYDLVHLYNFAAQQITEFFAKRSAQANVPFVVTTLYEDWPRFFHQMHLMAKALQAYVQLGQPQEKWASLAEAAKLCEPHPHLDNSWAAANAAALLATGEREIQTLRKDYGESIHTVVNHVGCDIAQFQDSGELFVSKHGMKDFVLCVGRLETRKNQLMLLKALEHSELPLVFAASGFTYQPEYAEACRTFKRAGQTVFLDRLTPEELSSAFAAAKVHALPSYYELPGIVSLEAARLGANIVVSDSGTPRDYFGGLAFYAKPDDPQDILNAVTAAFHRPKDPALSKAVERFTWDNAAAETAEIYASVLAKSKRR